MTLLIASLVLIELYLSAEPTDDWINFRPPEEGNFYLLFSFYSLSVM